MEMTLQLLTHGRADTLPALFESLQKQTDKEWQLLVLVNGPSQEMKTPIQDALAAAQQFFPMKILTSEQNLGFAGGHQYLFEQHQSEYVVLVNDDVVLSPDYVSKLRAYLDEHQNVGAVSGMLLRPDGIVDSLGLKRHITWKVSNDGEGCSLELDDELRPYERSSSRTISNQAWTALPHEVFGVAGTLPIYRRTAILQASHDGKLFDPDFQSYKEDVDLAFRFQKTGWKSVVIPEARAIHHRTFRRSLLHAGVSGYARFHSYRNHWWNLLVHVSRKDFVKYGLAIFSFEFAKIIFIALHDPKMILQTIRDTKKHWKYLKAKREFFQKKLYETAF